jgi:sterol 3beta-glucosyltransferase
MTYRTLALSSSIHTIYRPVARSRRLSLSQMRTRSTLVEGGSIQHTRDSPTQIEEEETEEEDDFEESTPRPANTPPALITGIKGHPPDRILSSASLARTAPTRTGSMATVKLQRQAKLADKLREIFDLPAIEEVRAEMPCWLLRSICMLRRMPTGICSATDCASQCSKAICTSRIRISASLHTCLRERSVFLSYREQ